MSYYTQSGTRKSGRLACNNPPYDQTQNIKEANVPTTTNEHSNFSPFNDFQASIDRVSYGSSLGLDTKHSVHPQDTNAFPQQPSLATIDSRPPTPPNFRGALNQKNIETTTSHNKTSTFNQHQPTSSAEEFNVPMLPNHYPSNSTMKMHNHFMTQSSTMMPAAQIQPATQQPQLPASHQTFQQPSTYVQPNNNFSTPMWKQPPPHSSVQHAPPNQHSMMHQLFHP